MFSHFSCFLCFSILSFFLPSHICWTTNWFRLFVPFITFVCIIFIVVSIVDVMWSFNSFTFRSFVLITRVFITIMNLYFFTVILNSRYLYAMFLLVNFLFLAARLGLIDHVKQALSFQINTLELQYHDLFQSFKALPWS